MSNIDKIIRSECEYWFSKLQEKGYSSYRIYPYPDLERLITDLQKGVKIMVDVNKGWECPRCKKINAPDVKHCDCTKTEETQPKGPEFLTE